MSYYQYIDKEQNCVFIQHYGEVGLREFEEQVNELTQQPDFVVGMNVLRDLSLATLPPGHDLNAINRNRRRRSEALDDLLGTQRKAAWILGNSKDFRVIHQFCAINRLNLTIGDRQPFREISRARKWLGIPEDYKIVYPDE